MSDGTEVEFLKSMLLKIKEAQTYVQKAHSTCFTSPCPSRRAMLKISNTNAYLSLSAGTLQQLQSMVETRLKTLTKEK